MFQLMFDLWFATSSVRLDVWSSPARMPKAGLPRGLPSCAKKGNERSVDVDTPLKINGWNLKITQLKRKIIFQTYIIGFHVNFPGCTIDGKKKRQDPVDRERFLHMNILQIFQAAVVDPNPCPKFEPNISWSDGNSVHDHFHPVLRAGHHRHGKNQSQHGWWGLCAGRVGAAYDDHIAQKIGGPAFLRG